MSTRKPPENDDLLTRAIAHGVGFRSEPELFAELRRCGYDTATLARLWTDIWAGVSRLNDESVGEFA
jgi:hypothetical protein